MTTRREEINALVYARQFLMDLMDPQKTPRVPKYVRDEARARLKHYPLMIADLLAAGPHDHEDDNEIPLATFSRYGKRRTITQVGIRTFLVAGESKFFRGSEDMFDFEGGPCYVVGGDFYGNVIVDIRPVEHGVLITVEDDPDDRESFEDVQRRFVEELDRLSEIDDRVAFDDVVKNVQTRFNDALDRLSDEDEELGLE